CFAAFDAEHVAIVSTMWAYHCQVTFTDNGGTTWTELEQYLPWNQYALCYTDDHSLIAGGTLGMLFNSNDGGYNWNVLNQRQIENSVLDVQFVTNTTGFLLSESYGGGVPGQVLYKTTNGGLNWNPVSESGHVYFLDSLTGFMIQGSYFQKTTDGGNSWQFVTEIENITSNFSDIKFYDQMRGMIAGEEILMCTTDGGLTWQDISPGIHNYNDIEYKTADLVYVTLSDYQNSVILSTPDHGTSWQQINAGEYGNANDLLLLNNDTAFLVCSYPAILRSTDACLTWQPMVINSTEQINYNSISFPDDLNGYVVGSGENYGGNILLKTMDGGLTWNPIESFVTSGLTQVHFFNNDTGLIFGKNGVVLSTSTGGIVSTANVEPPKAEPMLFSPNPFTTELHINNSQYSPSMIVITDVTGRRVLSKTISGESHSIDTSSLKPGIYTITFFENEKRISASKGIRL
ncbi:MAG: YCF48-related protein, partial [Chloroflexota bacterium]